MSELPPKKFQKEARKCLRDYLDRARLTNDPADAFTKATKGKEYRPLPGMENVPAVCLRLPTGGGKTLLAAMCVATAAQAYLDRDFPLVLWLVPSDEICQQTYKALANPDHPYRMALGKEFGNAVRVFNISDFKELGPQDIRTNVCVLIGTMQSLQVTNTAGRKVYAHAEDLEGHFTTAKALTTPGLEVIEAGLPGAGKPKFSFANLLKVQRPLLIVDEAHHFMTPLAMAVRQRIGAALVLELTATPHPESNELYRVSAAELKLEKMIKLPVVLAEHTGIWQQAVREAVKTRKRLSVAALKETEYVRPLLLIQAQNAGNDGDWAAIRKYLIDEEGLAANEIAVQTGDKKELEGHDLFSPDCKITTIITVQALKEGWDCSFAYVLCSAANIGNARDIEQLLGRVLRMPYARARTQPELNKAYAHVASERFQTAAQSLKDCLVSMGFEEEEAKAAVQGEFADGFSGSLFDQPRPFCLTLNEVPTLETVPASEKHSVSLVSLPTGQIEVEIQGPISQALEQVLLKSFPELMRSKVSEQMKKHNEAWIPSPAQRGVRFAVPRLTVKDETGERVLFNKETLREIAGFDLKRYPADVSGFDYSSATRRYTLDVVGELLELSLMGQEEAQLEFGTTELTDVKLAGWLDPKLRDPLMNQKVLSSWILTAVRKLLEKPEMSIEVLDRGRFILLRKLQEAIANAKQQEELAAYQEVLFGDESTAIADDSFRFEFPSEYTPSYRCTGTKFSRHYYGIVGEMKNSGEEYECAVEIDQNPEVRHWVRNLAGKARENTSFWLQTSTDRFYPDFVAELNDGTILVVEYKGEDYKTNDDSKEKDALGRLWALRSGGRAKFLMAVEDAGGLDLREQILAVISEGQLNAPEESVV